MSLNFKKLKNFRKIVQGKRNETRKFVLRRLRIVLVNADHYFPFIYFLFHFFNLFSFLFDIYLIIIIIVLYFYFFNLKKKMIFFNFFSNSHFYFPFPGIIPFPIPHSPFPIIRFSNILSVLLLLMLFFARANLLQKNCTDSNKL